MDGPWMELYVELSSDYCRRTSCYCICGRMALLSAKTYANLLFWKYALDPQNPVRARLTSGTTLDTRGHIHSLDS